jgi:uncharacterized protein (DUF1330 family)
MPKGYWIARVDVTDPESYRNYIAANSAPLAAYQARFLVRGGRFECPEGSSRSRNIVIEFLSYEQALACYRSEEYQKASALRRSAAVSDVIIVEGYEP